MSFCKLVVDINLSFMALEVRFFFSMTFFIVTSFIRKKYELNIYYYLLGLPHREDLP